MNSQANTKLFENWTDGPMPTHHGPIVSAERPTSNARIALIPLVRPMRTSALTISYTLLQRLIITVQLDPALVRQRWVLDISGDAGIDAGGAVFNGGSYPKINYGNANTYGSVQYHLPRTTLNEFTDNQGLPRISTELEDVPCDCPVFTRLTQLILPSLESPELFSSSFMDHFVMLFCAQVVHLRSLGPADKKVHRGGLSTSQKRRAVDLLSKGTYSDVRLAIVARECGLSVSHFARSFKTSFGQPVHRWVIGQRVARAKELLLSSNESLLEIAFQAGFCDQASFNRTFAKLTGTSPGRWRRDFKG
ncbi:MAG: AraC family transcriptional regulator [Edaphobacter sp.]